MEVNNFDSFNIYCGPAVLSIFTKARVDDCAEEIGKVTNQYKVKGVTAENLITAGTAMGLNFQENQAFQGRSIFWSGTVMCRMPPAQYLVTIPKHFIALEVKNGAVYICDNHTKTELELQNSSRLSQKIERVWRVQVVRPYSKPTIVKTEFVAERVSNTVLVSAIHTMSDSALKKVPLGSISINRPSDIGEIAFALMQLQDKEI
jgi:hypothetical protein